MIFVYLCLAFIDHMLSCRFTLSFHMLFISSLSFAYSRTKRGRMMIGGEMVSNHIIIVSSFEGDLS